jgi:hypothetical protein
LKRLCDWRERADSSGITALREFGRRLPQLVWSPSWGVQVGKKPKEGISLCDVGYALPRYVNLGSAMSVRSALPSDGGSVGLCSSAQTVHALIPTLL